MQYHTHIHIHTHSRVRKMSTKDAHSFESRSLRLNNSKTVAAAAERVSVARLFPTFTRITAVP